MEKKKKAALWARVSTPNQEELSLESQEVKVRRILEGLGYEVPPSYVLQVTWTSTDLLACPQFQQLQQWIANGEVDAVGVLDRDRLQAQGLQRLIFLSECQERGVEVVTAQGMPMLEGAEGQLVELALALGKERSVMRAQQGAKQGLRDRAVLRGLPPAPRDPYGYVWDGPKTRLLPTKDWDTARFICRSGLEGWPLRRIRIELHSRGIPSPSGNAWWNLPGIYRILTNPLYAGRFYALRKEHVEPVNRRVPGYGKTTGRYKPIEDAVYLSNIVVESSPLEWDEWLEIQKRMKDNKLKAQRNSKRDYLLRSLISCETHRRRFHGQPHNSIWRYSCPGRYEPGSVRCAVSYINGPKLEEQVKTTCMQILGSPEILQAELERGTGVIHETTEALAKALSELDRRKERNLQTEANLVLLMARGDSSQEAFDRGMALVKAEAAWVIEEMQRLTDQLQATQQRRGMMVTISKLRDRVYDKLENASNNQWREVFGALDLSLVVNQEGLIEIKLAVPVEDENIVLAVPGTE